MGLRGKSNKRRKGDDTESHKSDEEHQPLTQDKAKKSLADVGVPIGPKTTQDRLLALLDKHVTRKRFRVEEKSKHSHRSLPACDPIQHNATVLATAAANEVQTNPSANQSQAPSPATQVQETEVNEPTIDFSQFQDSQLVQLLRMVGVDTGALSRTALINQCQTYHELSIIPDEFLTEGSNVSQPANLKSATFTMQIPYGGSRLSPTISNIRTQLSTTTPELSSNSLRQFGALESLDSHDSIPEAAEIVDPSAGSERVVCALPKERVTKKKQSQRALIGTLEGSKDCSTEDLNEQPKPRRRTRSSNIKTMDEKSPQEATQGSIIQSSSKGSKSRTSLQVGIPQESQLVSKVCGESPEPFSRALAASQKGKGVDREHLQCAESDHQSIVADAKRHDKTRLNQASHGSVECQGIGSSTDSLGQSSQSQSASRVEQSPALSSNTPTNFVPSLEHGRLAFPRPNPTSRLSSSKPSRKSKVDSEWEFESAPEDQSVTEDASDFDIPLKIPYSQTRRQSNRSKASKTVSNSDRPQQTPTGSRPDATFSATGLHNNSDRAQQPPTGSQPDATFSATGVHESSSNTMGGPEFSILDLQRQVAENSRLIRCLQTERDELNKKVYSLTDDIKHLRRMVSHLKTDQGSAQKKTRGGRIASHIRFHIDTLLGMGPDETRLPSPASEEESSAWMRDIDTLTLDPDSNSDSPAGSTPVNPRFPYPNGPGHISSTPQQLAVMWRMMRSVGVSSFRPNFSESPSSEDNKWLWNLALTIFMKLVQCGEYNGVPSDSESSEQIKKSLNTYIGSLSKRYRQQDWDDQRKKKGADETRRKARMRHLKTLRDEIILSKEPLFCLSNVVKVACSDDETDKELESPNKLRPGVPCRVWKLPWRSSQLEGVFRSIDDYKARLINSIPKNSHGRPPRPRIRASTAPISPLKPPAGLPIDCYSTDWLAKLTPRERSTLEIQPSPILPRVITFIKAM